jgi:hypothetical protein
MSEDDISKIKEIVYKANDVLFEKIKTYSDDRYVSKLECSHTQQSFQNDYLVPMRVRVWGIYLAFGILGVCFAGFMYFK